MAPKPTTTGLSTDYRYGRRNGKQTDARVKIQGKTGIPGYNKDDKPSQRKAPTSDRNLFEADTRLSSDRRHRIRPWSLFQTDRPGRLHGRRADDLDLGGIPQTPVVLGKVGIELEFERDESGVGAIFVVRADGRDGLVENAGSPDNHLTQREEEEEEAGISLLVPGDKTSIANRIGATTVLVRVVCQENYFRKGCSHFCRPKDDLIGHFSCSTNGRIVCLTGWTGKRCTTAVCSAGCPRSQGSCKTPDECVCRPGWYGSRCEHCRTTPGCLHGTCRDQPGQCLCHKGWTGPLCDVDSRYCVDSKPCHHGHCVFDASHNYTCVCARGYTGSNCQVPTCHDNFCLNGGTCMTSEGTRYCLCSAPFRGPRCQGFDPHAVTSQTLCHSKDKDCLANLHHKPRTDVCDGHLCSSGQTCHVKESTRRPYCRDVDGPCTSNPCQHGGTCSPVIGMDTSGGMEGEGRLTDPDVVFHCRCMPGYSGELCEQIPEPPESHAKTSLPASALTSPPDRQEDCDDIISCQNGGRCVQSPRHDGYGCECPRPFQGEFCEVDPRDPCDGFPCLHKGRCETRRDEAYCACTSGYSGQFCEVKPKDPCKHYQCLHRGKCRAGENEKPRCVCRSGYSGKFCEVVSKTCSNLLCLNGGVCKRHKKKAKCVCRKDFFGRNCEKKLTYDKPTTREKQPETDLPSSQSVRHFRPSSYIGVFVAVLSASKLTVLLIVVFGYR